jgi:tetratricopeptide (TPR) repeat protein
MPKNKPSKQPWDVRAAEIVAGRAVDAGELIDLIHEVNPTGRGRGAGETAARYALKSRLQSLLVHRFADDLEVTADPDDPGVAALRHRYRRHDACHAVIVSLDDDARSWVQRQIDLAAGPPSEQAVESSPASSEAPPADDDDLSAAELVVAGEEAQAAYDYERAGRCFSRAVAASGGSVAAAVAHLAFTVDAMAADEEALALEGRLPAATLADPRVALLLALAAARAGDDARAVRHVARAHEPRVAEVLALLAHRALAAGDVERAARHVRAAEAADPAHPELRALSDGIAAARAVERAPREARLAALLSAGRDPEALAEAEGILARWPESEPARRALRQLEERQREGAGRRHLSQGEEALARGEAAVALEHLQRALGSPLPAPDRQRALGRVREAEALAHEQAVRAEVDQVVAQLGDADRARALAAYVELEKEARAAVRARVPGLPALAWMEAIPSARPGGRVRVAVEAVLALSRASSLVEKDTAAAAALLAPHERVLEDVPLFRSITERARVAAAAERSRRATAELREAEEALSGARLDRARALLDHVDLRALSESARAAAAKLEADLAVAEQRRAEERRFDQLRAAGAFRAARAAALAMAARDDGAERTRWTAEAAAIAEGARRSFAIQVEELSGGPELLHNPNISRVARDASAWVADGGRELVLCNTENAWGFLRFVDVETGRVVRAVRFALDEPPVDTRVTVDAGSVTLIGASGLFEIDVAAGEMVQRFERNWNRDRGLNFGDGIHPEGTRLLWGSYGFDESSVKIVDLDGGPAVKTLAHDGGPWRVVGTKPPRVVTRKTRYDEETDRQVYAVIVHDPFGAPIGRVDTRRDFEVAVAHPSGAGMVVLCNEYVGDGARKLSLLEISERFEVVAAPLIEEKAGLWPQPQSQMVLASDAGLVFVILNQARVPHATLVALRSAGPGVPLVEHYRVPVPLRTTVAHDRSGRRAFAMVEHPGGLCITPLGLEPPVDLPESGPLFFHAEAFEGVNWCALVTGNEFINVYVALRKLTPTERAAAIAERQEQAASDPRKLMDLFYAVLNGDWQGHAERILARAEASFPEDPAVRIAPFALLVARRAWDEVVNAVGAARERFVDPYVQHYHHLLATAHARLGDVDEALRHLTVAESLPPGACITRINHLRAALDSLPGAADDLGFDRPMAAQLVSILHAADLRMAEGDPAAAVAVLERPLTWDLREVHSLGRLATAYLELPAPTAAERLRKAMALACFVDCMDNDNGGRRHEGLAPGRAWPEDRLYALRTQAVAWLEADQGTTRTASWTED